MYTETEKTEQFLNVTNHGFLRVAAVVPVVIVGNPQANLAEHVKWFSKAFEKGANYVVAPELSLTGYTCMDLFRHEVILESATKALIDLAEASRSWESMLLTVGVPIRFELGLYNCAATILNGRILGLSAKTYIPNYREFQEKRWFKPAYMLPSGAVVKINRFEIPIGNDLIFTSDNDPNYTLFVEICEDLWKAPPMSSFARLAGANVIANCSASNALIGKKGFRGDLVKTHSATTGSAYIYSAAGPGEDVSDLAWDGHAMIAERGTLLESTRRFLREGEMIMSDVNLRVIAQDVRDEETNADCAFVNRKLFRHISFDGYRAFHEAHLKLMRKVDPFPFVPSDPATRDEHCEEAFNILSSALERKLSELPEGKRHVIGGISGGLDSTLMALIAAYTMDKIGLPRSNLVFATLPGFGTSDETYEDACALIRLLGADFQEHSIAPITKELFGIMNFDPEKEGWLEVVSENPQAWAREMILLSISARKGGIVLGTGDLSEAMQGWCTIFADHVSHYHINGSVPKTMAKSFIFWMRDKKFIGEKNLELRECLTAICARIVSPELLPPGADGKILQSTDEKLGPVDLRDFYGYWFERFGLAPSLIARLALQAFDGRYDIGVIKKWLKSFVVRFLRSQFKRSMAPLSPKIGSVSVSQRGDCRLPTCADPGALIEDLEENVPDAIE